jgi:small subunit ribosomal protein S3
MGQKVNPVGIRLGIVKDCKSTWYADKHQYADMLNADIETRNFLMKKLSGASVSDVTIERPADTANVTIHTARPGVVLGKRGEDVEKLRDEVKKIMGVPVHINISEIKKPE